LLLWHSAETDPLLRSFIGEWLFDQRKRGVVRVSREATEGFLRHHLVASSQEPWSKSNLEQSSSGLLRTAAVFGLMTEERVKTFTRTQLPDSSFLYVVYVLMQRYASSSRVVADLSWRLFMMSPGDVEAELLRLHQLHRVQFQRAGTVMELQLPCTTADEFARRMLA
jgi:NAD-specific glutamate dehydrogenase